MYNLIRKRMGLWAILAILALIFPLMFALPAFALTTADVVVNATPSYIAITCNFTSLGYSFGTVAVNTNYSSPQSQFGITNASSVQTDQTISVTGTNWTGGIEWVNSNTGTPGVDTAGLYASKGTNAFDVIVKSSAPNFIAENQAATTSYVFELRLWAPTAFSDGTLKTNTVRVSAAAG